MGQVGGQVPALIQMAQEPAQLGDDLPAAGRTEVLSTLQDELADILGRQSLQRDFPGSERLGEKCAGRAPAAACGVLAQATLAEKEKFAGVQDALARTLDP